MSVRSRRRAAAAHASPEGRARHASPSPMRRAPSVPTHGAARRRQPPQSDRPRADQILGRRATRPVEGLIKRGEKAAHRAGGALADGIVNVLQTSGPSSQSTSDMRTDLGANRPEAAGQLQDVYDNNLTRAQSASDGATATQSSSRDLFMDHYDANAERYASVATEANLPAELVAALHWRESSGNFDTYMHQGDPLGRPPVNWPTNIPTFHEWEASASHALGRFAGLQEDLGISSDTQDMAALATFAEHYNGLGYHYKDEPSPYVWAGTDQYESGKYVADGVYDANHVDQQPGVAYLISGLRDRAAQEE